jgi:hypothetical protein
MKAKQVFLLPMILLIIGCAHPGGFMGQNPGDGSIKETTFSEMEANSDCVFLGIVSGDFKLWQSLVPFGWAKQTAEATKDGAILKAQEMGGTHIAWREKGRFEYKLIAEGHVYKCGGTK